MKELKWRPRAGVALIEALVAVTLLASAGAGWIALAAQAEHSLAKAMIREESYREASLLLARYSRYTTSELESVAGRRRVNAFEVRLTILQPGLFEVTVVEQGSVEVLRTVFYRVTESPDAP